MEHEGHAGDDRPAAWKTALCGDGIGTAYNIHVFSISNVLIELGLSWSLSSWQLKLVTLMHHLM